MDNEFNSIKVIANNIELFEKKKIDLPNFTSSLEELIRDLRSKSDERAEELFKNWEAVEEVNALILDESALSNDDELKKTLNKALANIKKIINNGDGSGRDRAKSEPSP